MQAWSQATPGGVSAALIVATGHMGPVRFGGVLQALPLLPLLAGALGFVGRKKGFVKK